MDESTQGVKAYPSKQPEHKQDNKYRPEHNVPLVKLYVPSSEVVPVRLSETEISTTLVKAFAGTAGGKSRLDPGHFAVLFLP